MKNLNAFNAQELKRSEMKSVKGGFRIFIDSSTKDIFNSDYPKGERWFWQREY
ncbi:MAG: hypothetical protein ACK5IJ_01765 [Mangrovibacterium sp.]